MILPIFPLDYWPMLWGWFEEVGGDAGNGLNGDETNEVEDRFGGLRFWDSPCLKSDGLLSRWSGKSGQKTRERCGGECRYEMSR